MQSKILDHARWQVVKSMENAAKDGKEELYTISLALKRLYSISGTNIIEMV